MTELKADSLLTYRSLVLRSKFGHSPPDIVVQNTTPYVAFLQVLYDVAGRRGWGSDHVLLLRNVIARFLVLRVALVEVLCDIAMGC